MLSGTRALLVARISLGLAHAFLVVETFTALRGLAAGKFAVPVVTGLPAPTEASALAYLVAGIAAGAAVVLGWRTAWCAAIAATLHVLAFACDEQLYSNHRVLITLLLVLLACSRPDVEWAARPSTGPVRWGPVTLMLTQVTACYLFAGLSKINASFLSGVPLSHWMWVPLPWWAYTTMAIATVVLEVFMAVGLWLPRWRVLAALLGLCLHLSILVTMLDGSIALIAFTLACVGLYPLFLTRPSFSSVAVSPTSGAATPGPVSPSTPKSP